MRSTLPHRHVFFADADAAGELSCACGLVTFRDAGDLDAPLVVLRSPAPIEALALDPVDDVLLTRALEGLEAVPEVGVRSA